MVTVGFQDRHYEMIIDLIDGHLENLVNGPVDEIVVGVVNEWLDLLRALNDWDLLDLIQEYEAILDDLADEAYASFEHRVRERSE